jgi:hypothetical protein
MGEGAVRDLMQGVAKLSALRPLVVRGVAIMGAAVAMNLAPVQAAQAPSAQSPPVMINGWRYQKGASDVHLFRCEEPACVPGSRVSYRFYAAGTTMTLAQYRSEQGVIVKALQQKAPPGTSIKIVTIEGDDTDTLPRMYKSRRLTIAPDGSQEHVHSGLLMGKKASVSLISSSRDENAATGSFALFALPLMLVAQGAPGNPKQ